MDRPLNNYTTLKQSFRDDTGLDADKEVALYIQYYGAKVSDLLQQRMVSELSQINLKLDRMPENVRYQLADMLKTNDVIKALLKSRS